MRRAFVLIAASALLLAGCGTSAVPEPPASQSTVTATPAPTSTPLPTPTPTEITDPPATLGTIASGLDVPWSIAFLGKSAIVSERESGRILELVPGAEPRELATVAGIAARGEGGLLGIAIDDDWLYLYATAAGENTVQRVLLVGEPGTLSAGDFQPVISGIPAGTNHNGGRIAFGPDGKLYITTGDAGDISNSQNLGSLAGKILRLNPDGSVPADNPFDGSPVYSYGHRNPQGIGWGPDGTMYASEFGQDTWDELNVIERGGNYGWPHIEGIAGHAEYIDPVQQWPTSEASPSGIAVTDAAIYIANLRGQRLREVPLADLGASTEHFVGEYGRLRDAIVAPDGALWIVTNNTDGRGNPRAGDDHIIAVFDTTE